jgi:threonine dehydratase
MITQNDINQARELIRGKLHRTPVVSATALGEMSGVSLFLKCEMLQKTGSFKPRGALNKLAHLSQEEKARGLISASAGNHAQGVAYAARLENVRATIVMPEKAPQAKVNAVRGYGAQVISFGTVNTMFDKADEIARERGLTWVYPFDDPYVIAGQATIGMEILEDVPDVDYVFVPIGGGGLIAGISTAIKLNKPSAKVIGVETSAGMAMHAARAAGKVVRITVGERVPDGIGAPFIGELPFEHAQKYVDDLVAVDDDEVILALKLLLERCKLLVEGAGAATTASVLAKKYSLPPNARAVVVLSGGNIDLARLKQWV